MTSINEKETMNLEERGGKVAVGNWREESKRGSMELYGNLKTPARIVQNPPIPSLSFLEFPLLLHVQVKIWRHWFK